MAVEIDNPLILILSTSEKNIARKEIKDFVRMVMNNIKKYLVSSLIL